MQMNLSTSLRQFLLPAYYYGSWPIRQLGLSVARLAGKQPISVLYYHRVADDIPSPWTIGNDEFVGQVDWLQEHFEMISLAETQRRVRDGIGGRPAVSITFDDGYADNCRRALPLLIARGIPCTYFVATQFVLRGEPFPHDVARGHPLPPNTVAQLRSLAAAGVTIGAHTRTHCDLGKVSDVRTLKDEIIGSREDLQDLLGQPIRYFAFPYGQISNLSPAAFAIAREAGFEAACSAYGGYNFPGGEPFHLQRIHADPHFPRLKNWLNFEPRLLGRSLTIPGATDGPEHRAGN
jgi:peptidoglycan/xylan/chitin deacetylase (PgdA/CDA1 family)